MLINRIKLVFSIDQIWWKFFALERLDVETRSEIHLKQTVIKAKPGHTLAYVGIYTNLSVTRERADWKSQNFIENNKQQIHILFTTIQNWLWNNAAIISANRNRVFENWKFFIY